MREILFRGKRIDNGEWVEGTPFQEYNDFWKEWQWIIQTKHPLTNVPFLHLEIYEKTISQFTGLTDKNGKKIFEGDILRIVSKDYVGFDEIGKVEFKDGCFGASYFPAWERKYSFGSWHFHRIGQIDKWQDMGASGEIKYTYEVVGNIHDNPELLRGEEDGNRKTIPIHPCQGCVYYKVCGESTRTEPCYGRMTKRERRSEDGK